MQPTRPIRHQEKLPEHHTTSSCTSSGPPHCSLAKAIPAPSITSAGRHCQVLHTWQFIEFITPGPINQVPRLPWEGDQRNLGGPKPLSLWSKGVLLYLLVPPKSLFCPSNSIICRPPKIIVLSPQIPFLVAPKIILTPQIPFLVLILGFGGTEAVFIIISLEEVVISKAMLYRKLWTQKWTAPQSCQSCSRRSEASKLTLCICICHETVNKSLNDEEIVYFGTILMIKTCFGTKLMIKTWLTHFLSLVQFVAIYALLGGPIRP